MSLKLAWVIEYNSVTKMFHTNGVQKKAGTFILTLHTIDSKSESVRRHKIMIKGSIQKNNSIYSIHKTSKYVKQISINLKRQTPTQ